MQSPPKVRAQKHSILIRGHCEQVQVLRASCPSAVLVLLIYPASCFAAAVKQNKNVDLIMHSQSVRLCNVHACHCKLCHSLSCSCSVARNTRSNNSYNLLPLFLACCCSRCMKDTVIVPLERKASLFVRFCDHERAEVYNQN